MPVAEWLGQGLERRPDNKPEGTAMLDRYEQMIEATLLAGREREAFDLYWHAMGNGRHLAYKLGEYARAYRILRGFLPVSGDLKSFGTGLTAKKQSLGLNDLGEMARHL